LVRNTFNPVTQSFDLVTTRELIAEITSYTTDNPPTEEELAQSVHNSLLSIPGQRETNAANNAEMKRLVNLGLDESYLESYYDNLRNLDLKTC
jgi:zinc protease